MLLCDKGLYKQIGTQLEEVIIINKELVLECIKKSKRKRGGPQQTNGQKYMNGIQKEQ